MANKKFQNNQNKKSTESPAMNGNNSTATAGSVQNVSPSSQNQNVGSSNSNNNPVTANGSTTPTPPSAPTVAPVQNSNQSSQNHHHQKVPFTPSSSQSKQTAKKGQHEVEKIILQINPSSGSQGNQTFRGGGGNKDQKAKEKEKNFNSGRQGNQPNHHNNANHSTAPAGGGGNQGNQQGHRKKDNKNRDHSNQSHRGGGFVNSYGSHSQHQHSGEAGKATRFPSNSSLSSVGNTSSTTVGGSPNAPTVQMVSPVPAPAVTFESKTVQTDDLVEEEKPKPKAVKKEIEPEALRSADPKDMDTVMAFQEHDEWNRVELMCELLQFLSPTDLRLLGNCVDGLTRAYSNQMLPHERLSNGSDPMSCFPSFICSPQPPPTSSPSEATQFNQRSVVNSMFSHPPGLQPLMPNVVLPLEGHFQTSSSSNVVSPLPHASDEPCNGATTTSSTTGDSNNASSESKSQDEQTKATAATTTPNQPSTKTPEPEAAPVPPTLPTRSSSAKQAEPKVPQDPEKFLPAVRELANYLYILISVCSSTNRRSASKIADYVGNVLLKEKAQILERIPDELDKIDMIQDIGKLVAAIIHHPAVSLDDKIKYGEMRDGLRTEIESLFQSYYSPERSEERRKLAATTTEGVGDLDDGEESNDEDSYSYYVEQKLHGTNARPHGYNAETSSSAPGTFFITRFIGRPVERNENLFSLEIHWSDGDRTFTQRTKDQLKALQHRLLDEFGQQRSEKYHHGMASSISSFDEESKKLSASTSTMEIAFASSGERIVPRLPCDATPAQLVQYINELSDLPARMMLSTVICEEFNGTRARTEDEARDASDGLIFSRWKNPHAKSPDNYYNRDAAGNIEPQQFPKSIPPFLYSNIQPSHMQYIPASCSNCGGNHQIKNCDKATPLERRVEHKTRYDQDGSSLPVPVAAHLPPGAMPFAYSTLQPPMPHPMFLDNQTMMNQNYNHHQQHQMIPHNMYQTGAQFRNGPYADQQMMMFFPQQVVQNASNTNGNNGNGGSSQNNNF